MGLPAISLKVTAPPRPGAKCRYGRHRLMASLQEKDGHSDANGTNSFAGFFSKLLVRVWHPDSTTRQRRELLP